MKYRYHVRLFFADTDTEFRHSFNSNNEILWSSEIRDEIDNQNMNTHGDYHVLNICKTIND